MRTIILSTLLNLLLIFTSCDGQQNRIVTSIAEEPLQLENFDFETNISTLVPEKNKEISKYGEYYKLKSEMMVVDTIMDREFIGSEQPIRIQYGPQSYSFEDELVKFGNFNFNAISLATTLDGKIMVVNGLVGKISFSETQAFIDLLNKKYGKAIQTQGDFVRPFDIFTWQLNDRIIKYSIVKDNESNTMKIAVDKENKTIENAKKETHFEAYIYIIKKEYADKLIGKMGSDFSYCD